MKTNNTYLESFTKKSKQSPWVVTIASPVSDHLVRVTVSDGGEVELGPRLREVLSAMERRINAFPFQFTYHKVELSNANSYSLKMLGHYFVYLEADIDTYRALISKDFLQEGTISFSNNISELLPHGEGEDIVEVNEFTMARLVEDEGPAATGNRYGGTANTDYFMVPKEGSPIRVLDGDTYEFTVGELGKQAAKYLSEGDKIQVRLVGLDSPETKDHGEEEGNQRNAVYARRYGVTLEDAFIIGEEAKNFIVNLFKSKKAVVDFETDESGKLEETYQRYVGVVYAIDKSVPSKDIIGDGVKYVTHVNKTLLATRSRHNIAGPLGMPTDFFIDDVGYQRFDVVSWLYELGIRRKANIEDGTDIKDIEIDIDFGKNIDMEIVESSIVKVVHSESASNTLEFVKPIDDRFDALFPNDVIDSRVRIGDVCLVIPPLSIQVNRTSTLEKIKTLRSKSSIMSKTHGSTTTVTMQLYFHDLDSINGTKWDNGLGMTYYMDGLRPLIAQFKKAPFLPIDNEYINDTLGIHDVALVNLNVTTVPGFPHSIAATITLAKFETEAYMPQVESLGDAINYPLLRWFYQETMKEPLSPYRTYLEPIEGKLTNDFKFLLAEEAQLLERKTAIEELRTMDTPLILKERVENKETELGRLIADGEAAQKVIKTFQLYQSLAKKNAVPPRDSELTDLLSYSSTNPKYKESWKKLYPKTTLGTQVTALDDWYAAPKSDAYVDATVSRLIPGWAENHQSIRDYGLFRVRLYSDVNVNGFPDDYKEGSAVKEPKGKGTYIMIPGNDLEMLQKVVSRGYEAISSVNEQIDEYNDTKSIIENTEGNLDLIYYPIAGDILPISMNIVYENTFVPIQLQSLDTPTLQYLGSQDPYIEIALEANQDGVQGIRELMEEAERYSKEYRLGITSGFIGIENQLLQMFGITTVMPESVSINTVPGFPGRFQISMTLAGFDKTQKRTEALEGISPIYSDVTKKDRHTENVKLSLDQAVIEQKMKGLEVYPDMELPTYEELDAALPKIGSEIEYYENRAQSKFVDPDFYVATDWTFREHVRVAKEKEARMEFVDFAGYKMYTSSKEDGPIYPSKGTSWEDIYALDEEVTSIGGGFKEDDVVIDNQVNLLGPNGLPIGQGANVPVIKEWLKETVNVNTIPTFNEWKSWGYGEDTKGYESWLQHMQPTESQVYEQLYKKLDEHWITSGTIIYDDRKNHTGEAWEKATYGTVDDVYKANWNVMAATNPKLVKKKKKEGGIKSSDYKKFRPITRERLANYLKTILHIQSKWQHLRPDMKPKTRFKVDKGIYSAGIGSIDIAAHARDIADAKRLLWDWKHNLNVTVEYLYRIYLQASSDISDPERSTRPWDWMAHGFGQGGFAEELPTGFYDNFLRIFKDFYNFESASCATPTAKVDPGIMRIKEGLSAHEYGVLIGEKKYLLKELKSLGMKKKDLDKLADASDDEVRKAYEKYAKKKFAKIDKDDEEIGDRDGSSYVGKTYVPGKAHGKENRKDFDDEYERYSQYLDLRTIINEETNRLVNDVDPQQLFTEMFTDMIDYDMRGRLARAYPTFQLFIVDEGKWMTNYRMWDNLYGYNAIQSIDVHRSRKIAADTAVITMTNVYSNLTSRPMSGKFEEFEFSFWDNLVLGNPSEKIVDARKELLESMLLQAGARVHLRMGYGSDVTNLPTVFNGTITELDADDIVTIVCQGDGLELTSVISADPDDDNRNWLQMVKEPRDVLCELLTSKGNWFKDAINWTSDGKFFKDNPLGIQHFGVPGEQAWANVSFNPNNNDYGESAQNIYSSNGANSFSQWVYDRTGVSGEKVGDGDKAERIPWEWDGFIPDWQGGDEDNVNLKFYGQTTWDIAQTLASCSPDYIAAVHPFEMRSTLFFGKPYYRMAYKYDSTYTYNKETKDWMRSLTDQHRKPYMQFHIIDSGMDIVQNRIKASSDNLSTVVIVEYDGGKPTQPIYADYDINYARQRTVNVKAPLKGDYKLLNFWTTEKQAMYYGMSVLRDSMKDMYQGQIVLLGTPTMKPHDMVYMNDTMNEMNGNFIVKDVTHHFSYETGFITNVGPDLLVVNDDKAIISMANWGATIGIGVVAAFAGIAMARRGSKMIFNSSNARKAVKFGKKAEHKAIERAAQQLVKGLPDDDDTIKQFKKALDDYVKAPEGEKVKHWFKLKELSDKFEGKVAKWESEGKFLNEKGKKIRGKGSKFYTKRLVSTTKRTVEALQDGSKAYKLMKGASLLFKVTPLTFVISLGIQWGAETLLEKWKRSKACKQAVLALPLKHQGRSYEAGINGHRGMVVGDAQGKLDNFYSGLGFDGEENNDLYELFGEFMNWAANSENGKDFSVQEDEL